MRQILIVCMLLLPNASWAVDEPEHIVVERHDKIEIRQYQSMIVAEVVVSGDYRRAGNSGFRPLADFIFGNNQPAAKIDMTAPVVRSESTKIDMTAPVTRVANEDKSWTVAFVMPSKWTMETLPQPNNPDISIREVPAELVATIRFSGRPNQAKNDRMRLALEEWLASSNYEAVGGPRYAGYNAPWTPGPLRRNEVMIPVRKLDLAQSPPR